MRSFISDLYGFFWDLLFVFPLEVRASFCILVLTYFLYRIQKYHLNHLFVFFAFLLKLLIFFSSFITLFLVAMKNISKKIWSTNSSIFIKLENLFENNIIFFLDDCFLYFTSDRNLPLKNLILKIKFVTLSIFVIIFFFMLPSTGVFEQTRLRYGIYIGINTWKNIEYTLAYSHGIVPSEDLKKENKR